jgi:hypothetical protein
MKLTPLLFLMVGPALVSCQAGTPVTLNERLFELPSMKSLGGGCTMYRLGDGSRGGTAAGSAGGLPLVVEQRSSDDSVIVDVRANGSVVVERAYDLAFFQSGRLDELQASAGGETMLLRYWGGFDSKGTPVCSPLSDDGPTATSP